MYQNEITLKSGIISALFPKVENSKAAQTDFNFSVTLSKYLMGAIDTKTLSSLAKLPNTAPPQVPTNNTKPSNLKIIKPHEKLLIIKQPDTIKKLNSSDVHNFDTIKKIEKLLNSLRKEIKKAIEDNQITDLNLITERLIQNVQSTDTNSEIQELAKFIENFPKESFAKVVDLLIAELLQKAVNEEGIQLQSHNTDNDTVKRLLDWFRKNTNGSNFWQSLDDQVATQLIQVIVASNEDSNQVSFDFEELNSERGVESQDISSEFNNQPITNKDEIVSNAEENHANDQHLENNDKSEIHQTTSPNYDVEPHEAKTFIEGEKTKQTLNGTSNQETSQKTIHENIFSAKIIRAEQVPNKPDEKVLILQPNLNENNFLKGELNQGNLGFNNFHKQTPDRIASYNANSTYQDPIRNTIFNQLIERAQLFKGPQEQKILTIQLKPEFLGKVQMELTSKDGVVSARIFAENSQVKDKIEDIVPQIKAHLANQGINLNEMTVDIFSQTPDGWNQEQFSQSDFRRYELSTSVFSEMGEITSKDSSGPIIYSDPLVRGIDIRI